jgi:hypothetical protein
MYRQMNRGFVTKIIKGNTQVHLKLFDRDNQRRVVFRIDRGFQVADVASNTGKVLLSCRGKFPRRSTRGFHDAIGNSRFAVVNRNGLAKHFDRR